MEHLSAMVQRLHDVAPTMRSTLIMMPVLPQSSSPLGLIDDYKTVQQKLMEHLQHVDTRVVLPFELHPRAAPYSTMREWVEGRFAVDHSTKHNNTWIIMSELAIAGRPKGVMPQLPLQKDLLRVESLDPDKNVTTADKRTNSPAIAFAQKGADFAHAALSSCFMGIMSADNKVNAPVVVVDFTVGAGCFCKAVHMHQIMLEKTKSLYYVGWHATRPAPQ